MTYPSLGEGCGSKFESLPITSSCTKEVELIYVVDSEVERGGGECGPPHQQEQRRVHAQRVLECGWIDR